MLNPLKGKNVSVDLPKIPSLTDFQEYTQISAAIAQKNCELETRKAVVTQFRADPAFFDAGLTHKKRKVLNLLDGQLQAQAATEEELRGLEIQRQQVMSEISARLSREVFDGAVRTMRQAHAAQLREVALLEERIENYLTSIEQAGFRTGSLPRSIHLANLGRLSDRNSIIARVVAHGGVEEADGSTAPVKAAS